jgi:nucleolar GTP-binding protein
MQEMFLLTSHFFPLQQTFDELKDHLRGRGFDDEQAEGAVAGIRESRSRSASRAGRKRDRSSSRGAADEDMTELERKKARRESRSKSRMASLTPKPGSGMKDLKVLSPPSPLLPYICTRYLLIFFPPSFFLFSFLQSVLKVQDMANAARIPFNRMGKRGESDRHIGDKKPKHLFSGKRGIGKTDRR